MARCAVQDMAPLCRIRSRPQSVWAGKSLRFLGPGLQNYSGIRPRVRPWLSAVVKRPARPLGTGQWALAPLLSWGSGRVYFSAEAPRRRLCTLRVVDTVGTRVTASFGTARGEFKMVVHLSTCSLSLSPAAAVSRYSVKCVSTRHPDLSVPCSLSLLYLVKALMPKGLASSYGLLFLRIAAKGLCFQVGARPHSAGALGENLSAESGTCWGYADSELFSLAGFNTCTTAVLVENFLDIFKAPLGLVIRFHRIPRKLRKGRKDKKQFKLNLHFVDERQRLMYNKRLWALIFLRDFGPVFGLTLPEGTKVKKIAFLIDTIGSHSAAADAAPQKIRQLQMWNFFMEHGLVRA
jgi:hypothetical protein